MFPTTPLPRHEIPKEASECSDASFSISTVRKFEITGKIQHYFSVFYLTDFQFFANGFVIGA